MKITRKRLRRVLWEALILTAVTSATENNIFWKNYCMPILNKLRKEICYFVILTYPPFVFGGYFLALVGIFVAVGVVTTDVFFDSLYPLGFRSTQIMTQPEALDTWKYLIDRLASELPDFDGNIAVDTNKEDTGCSTAGDEKTAEKNLKEKEKFPYVGALIVFGSMAWMARWAFS